MSRDLIEREILIDASRERVWAVLTEAKHIAGWFGDSAEIDLRPGGKAAFGWSEHGTHLAVIERVDEPNFLSYRWARGTQVEPAEGGSTLVEFTLTEIPTGTLLRVVETGFASLHATASEQDQALQGNTEGWTSELAELKEYAERPAA
ncbi:MAG: SRPBCC family protein [Streptosporangiaceae bacterium]